MMEALAALALLEAMDYDVTAKTYGSMKDIIAAAPDYASIDTAEDTPMYVCVGSRRHDASKLPNLTFLPNLDATYRDRDVLLLGDTKGHHQDMPGEKRIQEIYEYQGYGAMVIAHDEGGVDLVAAQPGDKIAIPNHCSMTLYNMDTDPLCTLDFMNPRMNPANKNVQRRLGPILCVYHAGNEVVFIPNKNYDLGEPIVVPIGDGTLGAQLHEALGDRRVRSRFAQSGIDCRMATPEVEIGSVRTDMSLLDILAREDRLLQRFFGITI